MPRPKRSSGPGAIRPRGNVTVRIRDDVRAALQKEADARGRSLSEEIEHRLERSLLDQRLAIDALDLIYGPRLNDVLLTLGKVMKRVTEYQPFYLLGELTDWFDNPWKFDQLVKAVSIFLERLRPPGEINPPEQIFVMVGVAGLGPNASPEQKAALREAHERAAEIEAAAMPKIGAV